MLAPFPDSSQWIVSFDSQYHTDGDEKSTAPRYPGIHSRVGFAGGKSATAFRGCHQGNRNSAGCQGISVGLSSSAAALHTLAKRDFQNISLGSQMRHGGPLEFASCADMMCSVCGCSTGELLG